MTILDAVLAFALIAGLLTLVPGLDTALVLRSSLTRSRPYAWATAAGVATGAMVWGVAAAVGVSALLAASEIAYRALTVAGATYMLWLGGSMLVRSLRHGRSVGQQLDDQLPPAPTSAWRGWLVGAGTNLLNPKVGVFYIATIPQFLPAGVPPLLMGALLAGVHAALTMGWFSVLITGGRWARRWLSSERSLRVIDRITGVVLLGFGGTLAVESVTGGAPALRP